MNILKKITVDDKETMLRDIRRGQNKNGGLYGNDDTQERTFDSDRFDRTP